ncbi:MAG: dihydroorotate dehydrogenase electron transfer subunit [candidate division WOR-3 bacterium]|nr:dihydroorotate dehydrogenase electron transfer subunit [candidate division WOR-3 bacterium]
MLREQTKIIQHQQLAPEIYSLWLLAPKIAQRTKLGQFVQLQISATIEPFLPRPFSIADVKDNKIRIIYRLRGKGTNILKQKTTGDYLWLFGPLGKPLSGERIVNPKCQTIIICAGGIGIAPLLYVAKSLKDKYLLSLFYGAKSKSELILLDEFKSLCAEIFLATEDGSEGKKGLVTDLLDLTRLSATTMFTCGPIPMLKKIQQFLLENPLLEIYGFIENMMGCGCGLCFTCAIKKKTEMESYFHLCTDGPVFNLATIEL